MSTIRCRFHLWFGQRCSVNSARVSRLASCIPKKRKRKRTWSLGFYYTKVDRCTFLLHKYRLYLASLISSSLYCWHLPPIWLHQLPAVFIDHNHTRPEGFKIGRRLWSIQSVASLPNLSLNLIEVYFATSLFVANLWPWRLSESSRTEF